MKKGKRTIKRIKNKLYANRASAKMLAQVRYLTGYEDPEVDYNRTIQRFVPADRQADRKYMRKLKKDILFSEMYYGMDAIEYFRYRFEDLSDKARKTYVGRREVVRALMKLETPETRELFRDKYKTYKRFEKYYKRDIVKVGAEDKDIFLSFCEKHDTAMVKPYNSRQGWGVHKVELKTDEQREQVFREIVEEGCCVVEEVLNQGYEIAKYHPQSANTLRVITNVNGGDPEIILCTARFGTGDSVIDNGCVSAGVDLETGTIITPGREAQKSGRHLRHPDTGYPILGATVPYWDELVAFAKEIAMVVPEQRIVGWDLALSVDGWVIIEGNTRPGLQVLAGDGVGVRSILERITR